MDMLFLPFRVFIDTPLLALVPACAFLLGYLWLRSRPVATRRQKGVLLTACVLWFAYTVWEYLVHEWSKSEIDAVIRVDLILIAPVLILVSICALIAAFRATRSA